MESDALRCCVKCDHVLDRAAYAGVEVDLCSSCGGLWLDRDELAKLGDPGMGSREVRQLKNILRSEGKKPVPSQTTTACPACSGRLKEVVVNELVVDVCPACGGLWLDRGELDDAVQAHGSGALAALLQTAEDAVIRDKSKAPA